MKQYRVKETGAQIVGVLQILTATAMISHINDDGEVEWSGETDVHWNGQRDAEDDNDQRIFMDDDGNEYSLDDLEVYDPEEPNG